MKTLDYDKITIHDLFEPVDFTVTQQLADAYFDALQLDREFYDRLACLPAAVLERCYKMPMVLQLSLPAGTIHAKQYNEFYCPLQVGDVLTTTASIKNKYLHKGRKYVEVLTVTINSNKQLVSKGCTTLILA